MAVGRIGCAAFNRWYSKNSASDIVLPPFWFVDAAAPNAGGDDSPMMLKSDRLEATKPTLVLGGI